MAQKQIEIIINVEDKQVDIASKRTLTLTQQIKILKQELAKGSLGQKEFEIVAAKVGDLEDQMAKARRRSADFATTLQLIPGPVGEIASKVNGVIALLKQFSGFSFKDLQFQFKETANDLKEIFMNVGSWGEKTKEVTTDQEELNDTVAEGTAINASAGQAILQNVKAQEDAANKSINLNKEQISSLEQKIEQENKYRLALTSTIKNIEANIDANTLGNTTVEEANRQIRNYKNELLESDKYLLRYTESLKTLTTQQKTNTEVAKKDAAAQTEVGVASEVAATETNKQTVATENLTNAQTESTAAGKSNEETTKKQTQSQKALSTAVQASTASFRLLKGILYSLGIGLIIGLITSGIMKFVEWAKSIYSTERAAKKFDDTLNTLNRSIESNLSLVDEEIQIQTIRAQIAGATEKQLNDITIKGIDQRIKTLEEGRKKLGKATETLLNTGLSDDERKERLKNIEGEYNKLGDKIKELQSKRRVQEVLGEKAIFDDRKKTTTTGLSEEQKLRQQEFEAISNGRKEAFMSLMTDAQREEYVINEKYLKLERLAIKYGQDTKDLEQARLKELGELRKKNTQEELDLRLKSIDAIIEREQNSQIVGVERLKNLLLQKRDIELQNAQLTGEERNAIIFRYDKQLRDIDAKEREDKLVRDIASTRGNFDEQIRLYQEFQNEVVNSQKYNGEEQLRVINDTNEKIRQLQDERFQDSLNKLELEYGAAIAYDSEYFDKLRLLYDKEKQRYKELRESNKITQAEYTEFLKKDAQTRRQIDQEELNAKMANFQAVSQLFAAGAALVGEQTKAGKTLAIASATIDTYVAANQALKEPGVPKLLAVVTAAGIIIRGLANVKKIVEVPIPGVGGDTQTTDTTTKPMGTINVNAQRRAQGGLITGPGTETSDSIPAFLSNGEYVINARSTRMFQPILSAINGYGQNTPSFAAGGLVMGSQTSQQTQNSQSLTDVIQQEIRREPIRTYVTSQDVTNQQQFDRIIKSRSLI
jgi:hypothetical protein